MRQIRNILFPTDFSTGAEAAIEMAIEMAHKFNAKLTLLHAYSVPPLVSAFGETYVVPADIIDKLRDDAERAMAGLKQRAQMSVISVVSIVIEGIASDIILAVAKNTEADLIVMGTHGRTGLKHLLLGSVAELMIRTADCPVLTVRETGKTSQRPS